MIFFSKSLIRDAAIRFKSLRYDFIGSWIEFIDAFLKHGGENKSLDLYLADFYALKREEDETLPIFNRRFYNTYHDMPLLDPTHIDNCHDILCDGTTFKTCPSSTRKEIFIFKHSV